LGHHVFVDVAYSAFYAASAEWAKTNNITTGSHAGSNTFKPLDGVTRGESVTFLKRYDDIVQPALAAQPTDLWAKVKSDGSKADGSTGVPSSRVGPVLYIADFGIDVSGCSWSGVIRNDPSGVFVPGNTVDNFVTLIQGSSGSFFCPPITINTSEIEVWVRDNLTITDGELGIDGSFNIQVICA